ncbi:MAG: DsbE family thiol:disulfide interchange protein [Gammaproteobacteria bacterium CG22_combo_CG10-13_8_21_14_all_40_8]|nr:MAG: DsbE family thiol:disulfide interchange protein [Gammaproteobacteria bacterium CG22_combo_CG10-13_8_21_14_all_40_8]
MVQSKRLVLYLLPLTLFVGLTLLLYSELGQDPTLLESQLIGQKIPEFSKPLLMKPDVIITDKDIHGPALLNVWASWCPSCYHEHPFLMKLSAIQGVQIYGINYKDQRADALKYIQDQGNPYQGIIVDENGRLGIDLGVYGAPETFVIDKDNKIVYRHVGVVTEGVWESILKPKLLPAEVTK